MEKLFQFTSKWSNIDSGLKAGPGGIQMWVGEGRGGGQSLSLTDRNTDHQDFLLSA